MLFHFLSGHINLFRYLTFRSITAGITSFLLVVCLGPKVIQKLRELKFRQQIREEGPSAHLSKTGTPTMGGILMWSATIIAVLIWAAWNSFVLIACLSILLFALIGFIDDYTKIKYKDTKGLAMGGKLYWQSFCAFFLLLLIYMMPQYHQKVDKVTLELVNASNTVLQIRIAPVDQTWIWDVRQSVLLSDGDITLVAKTYNPETGKFEKKKLFSFSTEFSQNIDIQSFSSVVLSNDGYELLAKITRTEKNKQGYIIKQENIEVETLYRAKLFNTLFIPYYSEVFFYWPLWLAFIFYIFIIVGVSNATNLSDGLDGLVTGMGIAFYIPFGVFAYLMGNLMLSSYLFFPYMIGVGELSIVISAAIGAFSGFLWYNVHPAEVFMGDTGSLPMGAVIATIAIMLKQELILIIAGFMFVLETLSVILQVFWFKKFKRRLFRMAPIHHHFELIGWKENQVVVRFWIMSAFCAIIALASIKIR